MSNATPFLNKSSCAPARMSVYIILLFGCSLQKLDLCLNNQRPQGSPPSSTQAVKFTTSPSSFYLSVIFLLIHWKYLTTFPSGDMPLFIHSQTWSFVARHPTAKSTQKCLWSFSPLSLLYQPWIRGDDIFNLVAVSKTSKAYESYHS